MSNELQTVNKHPSIMEVSDNVNIVIDEMALGYTSLTDIHKALKAKGYDWSRGTVQRYYEAAINIMKNDINFKKVIDQRHILVAQAQKIAQHELEEINVLKTNRESAARKIDELRDNNIEDYMDQLTFLEQKAISIPEDKYYSIINKANANRIKAIEKQSELYGYRQDRTVILQNAHAEQVFFLDKVNSEMVSRFRDSYDREAIEAEIIDIGFEECTNQNTSNEEL